MNPDRLTELMVAALRRSLAGGRPEVPEAGQLLWGFFCELSAQRSYHFSGPNPISFAEIEAWARLHRWPLRPDHIATIRALDRAWLAAAAPKSDDAPIPSNVPRQNMTTEIFDLVWA